MASEKGFSKTDRIVIEHPKTGESYGVTGDAFDSTYEGLGFRAVSFEDGTPLKLSKGEQEAAATGPSPETENVGPAGVAAPAGETTKSTLPGRKALLADARKLEIPGRSKMSVAELRSAIDAANVAERMAAAEAMDEAAGTATSPVPAGAGS